jgi:hypothetical protein
VKIKHSKYRNTGLIFELLVKQIAADTLTQKESPAIQILRKFYTGNTSLVKEYKLYDFVLKNRGVDSQKAERIVNTIVELSSKLDSTSVKKQKYELIKELKKHYDLEEFFSIKVESYKPLAALYCLLEVQNQPNVVDPNVIVENKTTLLSHLTVRSRIVENKDDLMEEYATYDKDLKLLTYRILLEKFNSRYVNLLPEQKNILKEVITSANSTIRLRKVVNEEVFRVRKEIRVLKDTITDEIIKIKLDEVLKLIKPVKNTAKVTDDHLVSLMQYYELLNELKAA